MKIKEVSDGVKVSKNYNSYSINLVADLDEKENAKEVGELLIEKAKGIVEEKIGKTHLKNESEEKEVGAAWIHKKSSNFLSIKFLGEENWKDVRIEDLEKTKEGYLWECGGEIFRLKRVPEEKRKNDKMPVYRIYEVKNEN